MFCSPIAFNESEGTEETDNGSQVPFDRTSAFIGNRKVLKCSSGKKITSTTVVVLIYGKNENRMTRDVSIYRQH